MDNNLLGGLSEYAIYCLRLDREKWTPPFIHSFKAKDPFGSANYPLVDVSIFAAGNSAAEDLLHVQEIKATRADPGYFRESERDIDGLYGKSRLASTIEHMKFDLTMTSKHGFIPRINDCLGTCPQDSMKILIVPTGVSGDSADTTDCVETLKRIVGRLRKAGWPHVRGMYLNVPEIDTLWVAFATGQVER